MTAWCRKETFPGISPPSSASVAHLLSGLSLFISLLKVQVRISWASLCVESWLLSDLSSPWKWSSSSNQVNLSRTLSPALGSSLLYFGIRTSKNWTSVIQKSSFSFQSLVRAESSRAALSLVLHPPSCVLLKDSREPPMSSRRRPSSSEATLGMIPTPSKHSGLLSGEKGQLYWSETRESCLETRGTTIDKQRKIPSTGEVMGSEAIAKGGTTRTL